MEATVMDAAEVLANRGMDVDVYDDDLVMDAVLIVRVSPASGQTLVAVARTEGTDWIVERGLLEQALTQAKRLWESSEESEE